VRRQKQRTLAEVAEAGVRLGLDEAVLHENFAALDALLVDFTPDINRLTASDWAVLASDTKVMFAKLMLIKVTDPCSCGEECSLSFSVTVQNAPPTRQPRRVHRNDACAGVIAPQPQHPPAPPRVQPPPHSEHAVTETAQRVLSAKLSPVRWRRGRRAVVLSGRGPAAPGGGQPEAAVEEQGGAGGGPA